MVSSFILSFVHRSSIHLPCYGKYDLTSSCPSAPFPSLFSTSYLAIEWKQLLSPVVRWRSFSFIQCSLSLKLNVPFLVAWCLLSRTLPSKSLVSVSFHSHAPASFMSSILVWSCSLLGLTPRRALEHRASSCHSPFPAPLRWVLYALDLFSSPSLVWVLVSVAHCLPEQLRTVAALVDLVNLKMSYTWMMFQSTELWGRKHLSPYLLLFIWTLDTGYHIVAHEDLVFFLILLPNAGSEGAIMAGFKVPA